jgi:hypothetical protein
MANLFRKSTLSDDIASMRRRLETLAAKRVTAKAEFDSATQAREAFLIGGNIDDEKLAEKHETKVASATSKVSGLDSAIATMTLSLDDLEAKLRLEVEAAERNRVAGEIEKNLGEAEKQIQPWLEGTRTFIASLGKLENLSFEINQVGLYLTKVVGECELALSVAMPDLRRHSEAIRSGGMMLPKYPKPEPEVVEPQSTPTPTSAGEEVELWFAIRPLKYRDLNGHQHVVLRWSDVELPKRLVARATARQAIVPISDARRKTHRNILNGITTTPPDAFVDLDTASVTGDLPEGFERLLGLPPERKLSVPVERTP